jgi:hypothetical protein
MSQTADKRPNALAAAAIEKDVRMALDLFEGFVTPDRMQLPEQQFLKGDDETGAREALARLLRSPDPLDMQLRLLLASHFDGRPYAYSASRSGKTIPQELHARRRLEFIAPRGNVGEDQRLFKIGAEVLRLLDETPKLLVKTAIERTSIKYKLSEDRVKNAWEHLNKRGWKRKRRLRPLKLPPAK